MIDTAKESRISRGSIVGSTDQMVLHRPPELASLTRNFAPSRTSRQNYRSKFPPDGASWWLPGSRKSWDEENCFAATAGFAFCSRSCRGPGRKLQLRPGHRFFQI